MSNLMMDDSTGSFSLGISQRRVGINNDSDNIHINGFVPQVFELELWQLAATLPAELTREIIT